MIRKYPGLWLLVPVVAGIVLADITHIAASIFLGLCLICCLTGLYLFYRSKKAAALLFLSLTLGFFSALHLAVKVYDVGPNHIGKLAQAGKYYHFYGEVSDWPDLKAEYTEITIRLDSLGQQPASYVRGKILLKITDTTTALQRGDRVEFYGRLYPVRSNNSSEDFDYGRYLNMRGIFGIVYLPTLLDLRIDRRSYWSPVKIIDQLRQAITRSFDNNLEPTSAALAKGFLIGETRDIPPQIYKMFRDSGTLHLLAVSGSNVALVVLFFVFILRPFKINLLKRNMILLAVIVVFTLLSYEEPSVVRAAVMASLVILARQLQRRVDLNQIIAVTALIILMFAPTQLYDVGFQLSFITAWGLIFFTPRLSEKFEKYHHKLWYRGLVFPVMISVIAQVCSMPVIIYYFHRVPVLSVLANLVVVPLVSIGVVGSLILLVADLIWPVLGLLVGSFLTHELSFIVYCLEFFGGENIPVAKLGLATSQPVMVAFTVGSYLLLVLLGLALSRKVYRRRALIALLIILNVFLGITVATELNKKELVAEGTTVPGGIVTCLYREGTGQGDLIITGLTQKKYSTTERIITPWLERRQLEKIDKLFIHCIDYGAINNVLDLIHVYDIPHIYVNSLYRNSFEEVRKLSDFNRPGSELRYYGGVPDPESQTGYYLSEKYIKYEDDRNSVFFMDVIDPKLEISTKADRNQVMIIGRTWYPTPSEWQGWFDLGMDLIFCSKIAQYHRFNRLDEISSIEEALPDYLHDLSHDGSFRLILAE